MNSQTSEKSLEEQLNLFMWRNFLQTEMHDGDAGIEAIDEEIGEVRIPPTGACPGCDTSPMMVQALKARTVTEFEEIDTIHASTGGFYDDEPGAGFEPDVPGTPS